MKKPQYNPKYTTCMNMKSAYEQGKAEAQAETQKKDFDIAIDWARRCADKGEIDIDDLLNKMELKIL